MPDGATKVLRIDSAAISCQLTELGQYQGWAVLRKRISLQKVREGFDSLPPRQDVG